MKTNPPHTFICLDPPYDPLLIRIRVWSKNPEPVCFPKERVFETFIAFPIFQFLSRQQHFQNLKSQLETFGDLLRQPSVIPSWVAAFANRRGLSQIQPTDAWHFWTNNAEPEHMQIAGLINWQLSPSHKELSFVVLQRKLCIWHSGRCTTCLPSVEYDAAT